MADLPSPLPCWRVLGHLSGAVDGAELDLGPSRRRSLLALLVAHGGAPVSMSAVVDALWGTREPDQAINVVHKHVGSLRRLVDPELPRRATGSWLLPAGAGYRIDTEHADLDVVRFRDLVRASRRDREPAGQLAHLIEALGLWRGPAGDGLPPALAQLPVFVALNREHATAAGRAAELALQLGRAEQLLPALRVATTLHPLDELLHAQLIRVLTGAGLRGEASDHYALMRRRLVVELGLEPGSALRVAQAELLAEDVAEDVADKAAAVEAAHPLPTPAEIPVDQPAFVARVDELRTLRGLSDQAPHSAVVAVVTGPPGIGKTSLAVHHAHRVADLFPDGRLWVDLRGFDPHEVQRAPVEVLGRLLEALDVPREKIPHDVDARSSLYRSVTAGRRILILLDNARDAAQVRPLLPGSPGSMVIITSRSQLVGLRAGGAHGIELSQLSSSETGQFLSARLGPRRLDRQEAAVATLAELSGGLPLALAVAAARAAHAPQASMTMVAGQLRSVRQRLDSFADSSDDRVDVRSVFSWSYQALTTETARLFPLLALHPGPTVSVRAAASLADVAEDTARVWLAELAASGLVAEQLPSQYHSHDLLRAYSADLLERVPAAERRAAQDRLYNYASTAAVLAARAYSPDRILPIDDGVPRGALGSRAEGHSWFDVEQEMLVNLVDRTPDQPEYDVHLWRIGWAVMRVLDERGRWEALLRMESRAVTAASRSGAPFTQVAMRTGFARALGRAGRYDDAIAQVVSALSLSSARDADPDADAQKSQMTRGELYRLKAWLIDEAGLGPERAWPEALNAVAQYPDDDRSIYRAHALSAVAWCETRMGRAGDALVHGQQALDLLDSAMEYPQGRADTLEVLGHAHRHRNEVEDSIRCYSECLHIWQELGHRSAVASASCDLAEVTESAGDREGARSLLEQALEIFEDLDHERAHDTLLRIRALATHVDAG